MPELPEVETCKNGLSPHLTGKKVLGFQKNRPDLRWPISPEIDEQIQGQPILSISRRSKYLLFQFDSGFLVFHLGMSGSLRIEHNNYQSKKHDHILIDFQDLKLVYNDPRRFGACLWIEPAWQQHKLFKHLGPEPLSKTFGSQQLAKACQKRNSPIKNTIMDSKVVVGVGNIYACESLFLAKIDPRTPAKQLSTEQYQRLCRQIKKVLSKAIDQGGTTLKDFVNPEGKPGYFQQTLNVYGRSGEPCRSCKQPVSQIKQAGRSTFFCEQCQQ